MQSEMESKKAKIILLFVCGMYYTIDLALCQIECKASAAFFLLNTGETVSVGKDKVVNVRLNITQLCLPKYFPVDKITAYVVTKQPPYRVPFCDLQLEDDGSCFFNNGCSCTAVERYVSVSRLITQQENWLIVGSNKQWSTDINLTIQVLVDDDNATRHQYASIIINIAKTTSPTAYKVPSLPPTNGTIADASNNTKDNTQGQQENEPSNKNSSVVPFLESTGFIITIAIVAVMCVMFIMVCSIVCITGRRDKTTFLKGRNSAAVPRASGLLALLRLRGLPAVPVLTEVPANRVPGPQKAESSQPTVSSSSKPACEPETKQTALVAAKTLSRLPVHMQVQYSNLDTTDLVHAKFNGAAARGLDRSTESSVPSGAAFKGGTISFKSEYSTVSKTKKSSEVTSPTGDEQRVSSASVLDWPAPPVPLHPLTSDVIDVPDITRIACHHLGVGVHAQRNPRNNVAGLTGFHTLLQALGSETVAVSQAKQSKDNLKTDGVGYLVPYATVIPEDSC